MHAIQCFSESDNARLQLASAFLQWHVLVILGTPKAAAAGAGLIIRRLTSAFGYTFLLVVVQSHE